MAKSLKIFILVFALGIFIIPKQMLFAQTIELNCCSSTDKKDCCKDVQDADKPCHDSEQGNSCNNCTTCSSCHFAAVFFYLKSENNYSPSAKIKFQKEKFNYVTPEFSDTFSKIWQPPKIG